MNAGAHPAAPESRQTLVLGVIGGSGLYQMDALADATAVELVTPFGTPSAAYTVGTLPRPGAEPLRAVFLPRHGVGHRLLPSEINYRANIHGLKQLGVTHLVCVSAVGSLREQVEPGHVVLPDQLVDRTKGIRPSTFFGDGVVGHVQFGDPTCDRLRPRVAQAAREAGATVHEGGACIVMEGPAFSTRAESELYRSWGASIIGMTALPEAKLAREAEIAYAMLALSTDYDCWHEEEVSVEAVMAVMKTNIEHARKTLVALAASLPERTADLPYPRAVEGAVMTAPEHIGVDARRRLDLIVGHVIGPASG
ncbi:MAG: S-methyl-5'-thioadenosine phosphorylase [Myxococcota bacterium]